MITLTTTADFLTVLFIAAVAGIVGGVAAELLLNRNGDTGTFELPARKGDFLDLGGFASLLVGGIVGVAILVVFPPETTVVNNAVDGTSTSVKSYDLLRLVATALVAGSAGGSVLTALQARVTAAVNESRVQLAVETSQQQIDQLTEVAKQETAEAIRNATGATTSGVRPRGIGDPAPAEEPADTEAAIAAISATLDRQREQARQTMSVVGRDRR